MKITCVETIPFAIPYLKPLRFASGEVVCAEHVLVRVHTDEGLVGTAEAPPRPFTYGETQASIIAIIDTILAPQIVGLSPLEREMAHAKMNRTVGNPAAKSAIDIALWDLIGQTVGTSVTELLGGFTDRMRVAHMVGFAPAREMVAEAIRIRDQYGIQPYQSDVEVCRALRANLGADIELYIDGNRGWTAAESVRALRAMDDLDLMFAEEPCPADDVLGRRWLVSQTSVPIFADESVARPSEVTRELLAGAATGISIKTARTGFTYSQRVLHLCEGLGVDVVMGNQIDGQIGSLCTTAFGAAFASTSRRPGELSNFLDMSDDLLTEPLIIADGEMLVRQGAGLGIVIDEDKLAHYRQDTGTRGVASPTHLPTKTRKQVTMTQTTEQDATAAETGANATKVFQEKAKTGHQVSQERVATLASQTLAAIHDVIRRNDVTYAEYDALKAWLIQVGADGEWPLFLDVFVEHVVEEVVNANRSGTKGTIEGPFYIPGAPEFQSEATLPMRADEAGTSLVFQGQVRNLAGAAVPGAKVELWHADDAGFYAQFAPAIPEWNLRGTVIAEADGKFKFRTIQPAPYQIPHDGSTGALIAAAGWHAWRPAHLHLKVGAPGYQLITTQLYFQDGSYLDSDIASAVKPELMITPTPSGEGDGNEVTYDFVLDPA